MKCDVIAGGVLGLVFTFAVLPVAHADQMGDLCSILNTSNNNGAALNRQIANERNPLKKDSLQQQLQQINQQRAVSLDSFWKVNRRQFTNFTGVVSGFNATHYNTGPGVMLEITLPCEIKIGFQFIEITNPAWGSLDPQRQSPLSKWRAALENIMKGDSVTFSGRFAPDTTSLAVMTELRKKGGIAYKVPDPYLPPTTGTFSKPTVTHGGLIWMPPTFSRNWAAANAYCQGMSGWRLPTQMEVLSLVSSGAINGQGWFSPGYGQGALTSTPAGAAVHMTVQFQDGHLHALGDEYEQRVTCVRVADAGASKEPGPQTDTTPQAIPPLKAHVTDLTSTLSSDERAVLEQKIAAFNSRKGAQIAVLIVPTTKPETLDQYTTRVSEAWKLSRKGANNGVLLLVAKNDSRLRIEIDHGLEGALNDATAKRIIEGIIIPKFRSGDFFSGISGGVAAIITHLEGKDVALPK